MGFRGIFDSLEIVKICMNVLFFNPKEIFIFYQFYKQTYDPENVITLCHFRATNKKLFIFTVY